MGGPSNYRRRKGPPSGVPVIFIPGNAVDFNEDLSALHAPTLRSQAEFLVKAIARVLKAYDHLSVDERPTKVTLLGHSMGGIVARLATTLAQPTMWQPSPVDVIITMSTPHLQPPAPLDHEMERVYGEINSVTYSDPAPLLVSICGGASDIQIVSDACALSDNLVGPDDGFAVFSTGIPGVWTGVEHQAMVWCDQVRFRVARTLLDMGESASRQGKLAAAQQWLLGRSGRRQALPTLYDTTRIDNVASSMSVLVKVTYPNERSLVDPPLAAQFCRAEESDDRSAASTHLALHFLSPRISAVVAYRLTVETEQCSDRMPTVRYSSSPGTPFYGPSHESRFFPLQDGSVTLHSHISGSPFQGYPYSTQGISIDVFQHPKCQIRSISLSVDPYASLAKATLRLRIAVFTWCIGWVATIMFFQLTQYASKGALPSFSDVVDDYRAAMCFGAAGVSAVALIIQHVGAALELPTDGLFLGLTRVTYLPLMLLAAMWSWASVALVHILQLILLSILGRVIQPPQKKSEPQVDKTPSRSAIGSRMALGLLVLGLIRFVIPYRLAFGILFLFQFTLTAYASAEGSSSRLHLLETVLLLMTLLLPINLPSLAVWGKNVWIHGQHPFPEDRAILPILPVLVMVVRQAAKWTAAFVAVVAFMFAPSRPYIVGSTANVAFIIASVLMVVNTSSAEEAQR
ncbi:uncharacterized protein CcaverHIS019_0405500 [Cutaneotrichosporon cavernicola]|uniref:GPI inositol-deacylase n=1 Tax=Cutaneotrichosporon cavernicola TaxID=279322 RepID=A0AA48L4D2_9TREE|nr:uncharacterized protein CcaverHIS019_0405500 [Cutaneotrichosporon cavernicola]BEI91730.1 hypothetical protein CcaverHIS019_0405500 [Cutaneotrichosporon cavernicola]